MNDALPCRVCQHDVRDHDQIKGCDLCLCMAHPGEANPQTTAEADLPVLVSGQYAQPSFAPREDGATAPFTLDDLNRLREVHDEINRLRAFIVDRALAWITAMPRRRDIGDRPPRRQTLSVPDPLAVEQRDQFGECFYVREELGGDQYGVDYAEHYVPVAFVLGGKDAEDDLARDYATYLALKARFEG